MRLIQMVVVVLLVSGSVAHGQISQTIDGYGPVLNPYTSQIPRPFIGRFEFEGLPKVLRPVTVDFALEVAHDKYVTAGDWDVVVSYDPRGMRLLSDSLFLWPEPHKVGDRFTGSLVLKPIASGPFYFTVQLAGNRRDGLVVQWCFDGDGELQYLGRYEDNLTCYEPYSCFFEGDTVYLYDNAPVIHDRQRHLFEFSVVVTPPFRIGDTSTVIYYLEALKDLAAEPTIEIHADGMRIVSDPVRLAGPINTGQLLTWEIKAVPLPVRNRHLLVVEFNDRNRVGGTPTCNTAIPVASVFNDDGSLRLVGDMRHAYVRYLPDAFRSMGKGDSESIVLMRNDAEVRRQGY